MAEEVTDTETGAEKVVNRKFRIIALVIIVVLLSAMGAGAFFYFSNSQSPEEEVTTVDGGDSESSESVTSEGDATEGTAKDSEGEGESSENTDDTLVDVGTALYVAMPRPFLFNVQGYGRNRLVQIKVQLLVRGLDDEATAQKHIPLIEDTLLTSFSTANAERLATNAGKQQLRTEALDAIQDVFETITGNAIVEEVLFIGFVMQ